MSERQRQPWTWRRLPSTFSLRSLFLMMLIASVGVYWWNDRRQMIERIEQLETTLGYTENGAWSADQATGKPDSPAATDQDTAWAPATQNNGNEWIELTYAKRTVPSAILIHEVCSGGCVYRVTGFTYWGKEVVLWQGTDPTQAGAGRGISTLQLKAALKTNRIKIYLDTKKANGWNEIDAVGLQDAKGKTIWAERAKASSSYGAGRAQFGRSGYILDVF